MALWAERATAGGTTLHTAVLRPAAVLRATPIVPLAVASTPVHRRLLAAAAGQEVRAEYGFLSMDSTRRAVLLQPSDPAVQTRPLIGVWASGVQGGRPHTPSPQRGPL